MPKGIYKHRGMKGRHWNLSEETKEKMSKSKMGRKLSEETKRKLRLIGKGRPSTRLNYRHSEETKRKIGIANSIALRGRKLSLETRRKISESTKGENCSEERRRKIGEATKKRYDIIGRRKHPRYYHGLNTSEYKRWRIKIFLRDNFTCMNCRKVGIYLVAHHIKSWAHYPKLRFDINNGITLCKDCHKLTDNFCGKGSSKKC